MVSQMFRMPEKVVVQSNGKMHKLQQLLPPEVQSTPRRVHGIDDTSDTYFPDYSAALY
jgi:hypothetical protein